MATRQYNEMVLIILRTIKLNESGYSRNLDDQDELLEVALDLAAVMQERIDDAARTKEEG